MNGLRVAKRRLEDAEVSKIRRPPCPGEDDTAILSADDRRPDLVLPGHYERIIHRQLRRELAQHLNVFTPSDLPVRTDSVRPILLTDDGRSRLSVLADVVLRPHFEAPPLGRPGVTRRPHWTSHQIPPPEQPMYSVDRRQPRYVIWPADAPLTVCGTVVDRIDSVAGQLSAAVRRALDWARPITRNRSIVVFDLDETLVDDEGWPLEGVDELLESARGWYDLMVLYSHGSHLHVDECRQRLRPEQHEFDLVLSHDSGADVRSGKNLLYLYNLFEPGIRFTQATLVDDSLYNWTPEYTRFVVPARRLLSLRDAALAIDPRTHDSAFAAYVR